MCNPALASYAMAAISAVQEVSSIRATNAAAKAEVKAAEAAAAADTTQIQLEQNQINTKTSQEKLERQRQALKERARLTVAIGDAGVGGNSPMREINNSFLQEAYDVGILETNRKNAIYQTDAQQQSVNATLESRKNAAKSKKINPFMSVLSIGSAAASGFGSGFQLGNTLKGY